MVVDAFEVLRLDDKMGDIRITTQLFRHVPCDVFNEFWVFEGLFRHELLILPLEHRVNFAARTALDKGNQIFYPKKRLNCTATVTTPLWLCAP